jgi:uncharacterized protein (DUF169 family)
MTADMKIPINYAEASETLKKYLKLSGSPVAFRFVTKKEEIPAGMQKFDKTVRHCTMAAWPGMKERSSMQLPRTMNAMAGHGRLACGKLPRL